MKRVVLIFLFVGFVANVFAQKPAPAAQTPASAVSQPALDKKTIVANARKAYYNLRSQGLVSFHAQMQPDFAILLAEERKKDPNGAAFAERTLRALHFGIELGPEGD